VLWNIPVACDRASADFMITSPLMEEEYQRILTEEIDSGEHRRLLLQQMDRRESDGS
jgi:methylglyoxal synthase